jgi:hypothetical protein
MTWVFVGSPDVRGVSLSKGGGPGDDITTR